MMIRAQTNAPLCRLCAQADPNVVHSFGEFFAGGGMARVGLAQVAPPTEPSTAAPSQNRKRSSAAPESRKIPPACPPVSDTATGTACGSQ